MRSFKVLAIAGLSAIVVTAESDSGCSSPNVLTVYVTVPATSITETVYASGLAAPAIDPTVTSALASTQFINLLQATDQPGPYSFTEDNGTTSWMGGRTPPASAKLVTSTSIITLQPVSTIIQEASSITTTSYLTVTPTQTVTHTFTQALVQSASKVSASAKGFPEYSLAGWNASVTTFLKLTIAPTGSLLSAPSTQSSASGDLVSHYAVAYVTPTAYGKISRRIKPRQVEDIVLATIDGVSVSWTNNFDGSSQPMSETGSFVPVTATAPSFRGAAPLISSYSSSPAQTSLSSGAAQATTGPTTSVNSWIELQPGVYPPPSIPSGFQWISTVTSTSTPISTTQTATQTAQSRPITSSQYALTAHTSALTLLPTYMNASTATISVVTTPTPSCGGASARSAVFTVDFDDLPFFSAGPDDTDIPPIFNPYRKLYWEGHFGYVPPPTDPFPPHSPPQLAVYRGSGLNANGSSDAGLESSGEIGAGPRADNDAYWIDAFSVYLGCADGGPNECIITINGYANEVNTATATQTIKQPPCLGLKDCSLASTKFDDSFRGLTGLQILAAVDSKAVDYYIDDLQLGWSNNSCAAQLVRASSR